MKSSAFALAGLVVGLPLAASGCLGINLDDLLGKKSTSSGCQSDIDCNGSDVCVNGKCQSKNGAAEGEGEGAHTGEGEGEGGGTVVDPNGPQFLQFSTNITTMGPSDTLIFTVVVTHPDGIQNVVGGSLVDPSSGASYGAFTTLSTTGSYQFSLSWEAINEVKPIDFSFSTSRTFTAQFFDQAGHVSQESTSITLACGGSEPACGGSCGFGRCGDGSCTSSQGTPDESGNGLCNNTCESLVTSSNCGSCGNSCNTQCGSTEFGFQCTCNTGFDCSASGGNACVNSTCTTATLVNPSSTSSFFPQAQLAGQIFDLCVDSTAAALICAQLGFSGGSITSSGSFNDSGAVPSCFGASSLEGCSWTETSSCTASAVICGSGGGGGGDLSCAVDGSVADNQTASATIGSRFNSRSESCSSSSSGPEAFFTFTAPTTRNYEFVAFGGDSGDQLSLSVLNDCNSSELACAVDTSSGFNEPVTTMQMSAGQTVVLVVDTAFAPSAAVSIEALDD